VVDDEAVGYEPLEQSGRAEGIPVGTRRRLDLAIQDAVSPEDEARRIPE